MFKKNRHFYENEFFLPKLTNLWINLSTKYIDRLVCSNWIIMIKGKKKHYGWRKSFFPRSAVEIYFIVSLQKMNICKRNKHIHFQVKVLVRLNLPARKYSPMTGNVSWNNETNHKFTKPPLDWKFNTQGFKRCLQLPASCHLFDASTNKEMWSC